MIQASHQAKDSFGWITGWKGNNTLRAPAPLSDEILLVYQTKPWGAPAMIELKETARNHGLVTLEARVVDQDGIACLDAANLVKFGLTGDRRLWNSE